MSVEKILVPADIIIDTAAQEGGFALNKPSSSMSISTGDDCGNDDDGYNGAWFSKRLVFTGSAVNGDRVADVYVLGELPPTKSKFTAWTLAADTAPCTQVIDGVAKTFKKYSATCDLCVPS